MQTRSPKDDELKVVFKFTGCLVGCWRVKVALAFLKAIVSYSSQSIPKCGMLNGEANFDF